MPTYEYKCFSCDHAFERFQSITAAPIKKCPECGKAKVKRLLGTGAGLIFKGSGFYITDYRSESYKSGEKGETPSSGEAKSDTKAEPKGDAAKSAKPAESPAPAPKAESKPAAPAPRAGKKK